MARIDIIQSINVGFQFELQCQDTKNGECFQDQQFIGAINGRTMAPTLKLGVAGSFELQESTSVAFNKWDEIEELQCLHLNETALNGGFLDERQFHVTYSHNSKDQCLSSSIGKQDAANAENALIEGPWFLKFTKVE